MTKEEKKNIMNKNQTPWWKPWKRSLPEMVDENILFGPYWTRQQLGCPLFLLDEWAPLYKATLKWGAGIEYTRQGELHFVLAYFPVQIINIILHCPLIIISECCITPNTWFFPLNAHGTDHTTDDRWKKEPTFADMSWASFVWAERLFSLLNNSTDGGLSCTVLYIHLNPSNKATSSLFF